MIKQGKLSLALNTLQVESFTTLSDSIDPRGTILAYSTPLEIIPEVTEIFEEDAADEAASEAESTASTADTGSPEESDED